MPKHEVRTTRAVRRTGGVTIPASEVVAEIETYTDGFDPHTVAQYLRSGQLECVPVAETQEEDPTPSEVVPTVEQE